MKNKKLTLICSIGLILVLLASLVLSACAKEEAPAAPAKPAPAKPAPTTPAKPAPATPAPTTPAKPAPAPAAEVFKWTFQTHDPGPIAFEGFERFGQLVADSSGGRIVMKVFPADAIVGPGEMLNAVNQGVLDIMSSCGAYYAGTIPEGHMETGLPMTWRSGHDTAVLLWEYGLGELFREAYLEHGVYYLGSTFAGKSAIATRDPYRNLEELKNAKLRCTGTMSKMFDKLGVATVYIPASEILPSVTTGVVDGAAMTAYWQYENKLMDTLKYYVMNPLQGASSSMYVNLDNWESLPEDLQSILQVTTWWWEDYRARSYDHMTIVMEGSFLEPIGVEKIWFPEEDMLKMGAAATEYWDEYAEISPRTAKIIEIVKKYGKDVGWIK